MLSKRKANIIGTKIQKSKMAVLIVEQYLEFVLEIADYCYAMENDRIIMDGELDSLVQQHL